eukprot:TRINITY_DN5834_c0_g1_i8.p1 TRINITY_DN5834_c0_g1~~TRINITY_DN5834_c0_g1_i8.p1  ORF type:complete len:106 (-),score=21.26 TRINITY_DN5834_c0_g1_i8:21-299(-)
MGLISRSQDIFELILLISIRHKDSFLEFKMLTGFSIDEVMTKFQDKTASNIDEGLRDEGIRFEYTINGEPRRGYHKETLEYMKDLLKSMKYL